MKAFVPVLLLAVLLAGQPARGQVAVRADSTRFNAKELIAPGVLLGAGTLIHCFGHDAIDVPVQQAAMRWRTGSGGLTFSDFMSVLPVVPVVVDVGLGVTGVKAQHGFVDRALEAAIAASFVAGTGMLMKKFIYSPRPDGTDDNSFPSGHTCVAFMGAELVRMEYGWGWGTGAYVVAAAVAMMRSYHERHWLSDLLAGAGVGILGAHVGRWLLEPARHSLGLDRVGGKDVQASLVPYVDPLSGSFCASLAFNF